MSCCVCAARDGANGRRRRASRGKITTAQTTSRSHVQRELMYTAACDDASVWCIAHPIEPQVPLCKEKTRSFAPSRQCLPFSQAVFRAPTSLGRGAQTGLSRQAEQHHSSTPLVCPDSIGSQVARRYPHIRLKYRAFSFEGWHAQAHRNTNKVSLSGSDAQ